MIFVLSFFLNSVSNLGISCEHKFFPDHHYFSEKACPSMLVIGQELPTKNLIEKALSKFHKKNISIISKPSKKDKGLMEICKANTEFVLKKDKTDPHIDYKLEDLEKELQIDEIKTIESYDISHHSGKNAVAGCAYRCNFSGKRGCSCALRCHGKGL